MSSSRARRLDGPAAVVVTILVAAHATALAALAAPAGVLFDGRVTVVVRSADGSAARPGPAIDGVDVTLVAYLAGGSGDGPVGEPRTGTTGPDGSVELTGVARPTDPSVRVRLAVDAMRRSETVDANGCTRTEVWAGNVTDVVAPPPGPLIVPATEIVATSCPERPVLEGRLLDHRGEPLVVREASVSVSTRRETARTLELAVGADGAFLLELPAIGTWIEPATLTVHATGATSRDETDAAGCVRTWAPTVTWSSTAALAEGATLPWLELVATETVVGERCGAVATRPPATRPPAPIPATPKPAARPAAPRPAPTPRATPEATRLAIAATPDPTSSPRRVAVVTRTPAPRADVSAAPPAARSTGGPAREAGAAAAPGASPTTAALLAALVAMAVTLAIAIRVSRRV